MWWQSSVKITFTLTDVYLPAWLDFCLSTPVLFVLRGRMTILLRVDRRGVRVWHLELAQRLARRGAVGFRLEAGEPQTPGAAGAVFQIETILFGLGRGGVSDRIDPLALAAFPDPGAADLILDFAASPLPPRPGVWRVDCDGAALEPGLLAAILGARAPIVRLVGPQGVVAAARPGSECAGLVKASFEDMLARVATLIEAALDGAAPSAPCAAPGETDVRFDAAEIAPSRWTKRALATFRRGATRAIYRALFNAPQWRVGWRPSRGAFALGGGWTDLPDDGRRFYADPFPVAWRGRTFLFVEEFEHALGRGIISVVEFGPDGPKGAPQPCLERPGHLSYPNVFGRDGEMWMIPESSDAGTIDLYRALDFPFRWKLESTLASGVCAGDATLIEQDGRWWMFATVRDGGCYSDSLWLWSAPDFRGPWTPHKRNPVLIDSASARPAGRMFFARGSLYRPVQDCRAGYGAALGLARVDRLDDEGFAQTLQAVVRPGGPDWPGRRLHSFNEAGGFEFIDGSAFSPRWPALRHAVRLRPASPPAAPERFAARLSPPAG